MGEGHSHAWPALAHLTSTDPLCHCCSSVAQRLSGSGSLRPWEGGALGYTAAPALLLGWVSSCHVQHRERGLEVTGEPLWLQACCLWF